jgi:hypothetical protein
MTQRTVAWSLALLSLAACTSNEPPAPQSQTHWLAKCEVDDDCGGLSCICGSCAARCAAGDRCSVEGLQTECQASTSAAVSALCDGRATTSVCLVPCDGGCRFGERCVGNACVPDASASGHSVDAATGDSGASNVSGGTGGVVAPPALDASTVDGGGAPADAGGALTDAGATPADGSIPGVDCGPNVNAFPSFDRSCSTQSDCAIGTLREPCSVFVTGIRASEADAYAAAAKLCESQLSPSMCPAGPSFADDGSMTTVPSNTEPLVDCVAGQCQTSFGVPTGMVSCGGDGTQCDARTQICVERVIVGVDGTYGCEPAPASCPTNRSCDCVAATLCTGAYNECWNGGYDNVSCACRTCQ